MSPRSITHGLRRLFRRAVVDKELNDEVAHYLEMSIVEHMRNGLSRADAERAARVDFGGVEAAKEGVRGAGWESIVDSLAQDVQYALRNLRAALDWAYPLRSTNNVAAHDARLLFRVVYGF